MDKFNLHELKALCKNFFSQFKHTNPLMIFTCLLGLVWLLTSLILLFTRNIIVTLFSQLPSKNSEHVALQVVALIIFSFAFATKFLCLGVIDVAILVVGFFYDIHNKITSFGKGTSFFITW